MAGLVPKSIMARRAIFETALWPPKMSSRANKAHLSEISSKDSTQLILLHVDGCVAFWKLCVLLNPVKPRPKHVFSILFDHNYHCINLSEHLKGRSGAVCQLLLTRLTSLWSCMATRPSKKLTLGWRWWWKIKDQRSKMKDKKSSIKDK